MAIDRNKIIEAATKYVQKGQFDKAIREYSKLLDADPKDARIQQKLGELYQKKGDSLPAAECFLKVAESYAADGFFLKAVAVYKQVLRLNPNLIEVNLKLAELHQQLGLMSDAMAQYQLVANHYEKTGNMRASLDTLHKMVELDPDNVASRIKLAELYARQHMNEEAKSEFQYAADYLRRNNRVDDYLKVAERLVFLDPGNLDLTRELARIYLSKQDIKHALAKLQLCFKANPKDIDTLKMLAQAFEALGQIGKTVSVYKELTRILADKGRSDEEKAIWRKIIDLAPDDEEARAAIRPPQAAAQPAAVPGKPPVFGAMQYRPPAPSQTVRVQTEQLPSQARPPTPEQIHRLLTETEVYEKYGLREKALSHIRKILSAAPNSIDVLEKACRLFGAAAENRELCDCLAALAEVCLAQGDHERAQNNIELLAKADPSHPKLSQLLAAAGVGGTEYVGEEVAHVEDGTVVVEEESGPPPYAGLEGEEAGLVAAEGSETYARTEEYETEEAEEAEVVGEYYDDDPALAAAASSLDQEENVEAVDYEDEGPVTYEARQVQIEEDEIVTEVSELVDYQPAEAEYISPEDPAGDELDEATFFLERGMYEEANEILQSILSAYPGSARASELMAQLIQLTNQGQQAEQPILQEPVTQESQPYTDMAFDLASELAVEEFDPVSAPVSGDDFQYSVEDVLGEFKKGLKNVVKPEDVDTHYDLGIAYKEMGLLDDAIGEFRQAASAAAGMKREVECLAMIGVCCMERDRAQEAIDIFQNCLALSQINAEMAKSVRYELGLAFERVGQFSEALHHMYEVEKADARYRDVEAMIERLRSMGGADTTGTIKDKKAQNIGYV